MKILSVDIESFSSVNLQKSGVYKYCESEDFEILLFAYSVDNAPVQVVDLANGEELPPEILSALTDDSVQKCAFNASFERICLSRFLGLPKGQYLNPKSWRCTMIWAATLGLPLSLAGVGAVLGLDKQKLAEGKNLIRYFCVPCTPTKTNGGRIRNLPIHDLKKWELFKSYNVRDVEVEMAIQKKLSRFPVSEEIWAEYQLSEEINDIGIGLDMKFVASAIKVDEISKLSILSKLTELTGLENPNSVLQMRKWLLEQGLETDSLGKKQVEVLVNSNSGLLKQVLLLRQKLAKSSVKKYQAMENYTCSDNRAHGLFQFYGANRTGRFAGRGIQLQNLPQNHMLDLSEARLLVREGNYDALTLLYDSTPEVLSELIRTAFVPQDGKKFIVSDFSAIEARVIAWLAGENWRLEVFKNGGDIYCASASQMFHVPVEKNGENAHLRQKGKIAELALGYGGSVGALTAMGALDMGLAEDELQPLVTTWRNANPHIVKLWWEVDKAIKNCIKQRTATNSHGIKFTYKSGMLFITLLSGRKFAYVKPRIGENRFGGESVTYEGVGVTKKWERLESYGPKFVENIVQAMARDILCFAMKNLSQYRIVGHVHDELIIEVDEDESVSNICEQMSATPPWAKGLLLNADGYECEFYKKE
ncbi:DNA polymerase [Pseudolactococcus insecticola]|uniref:DNA-directed DNA polymerase n=1 Tax=Pseudolactococcus insecticola TaxID=2709158 RepID=A0A6A0B8T7_9LACT|nr:DNA polymerase [Lactococcus insecticola]GFH40257.1 DNA polymerase [Lactococcus insecticola]